MRHGNKSTMKLTLIAASGTCHSTPRDKSLHVRSILSLLSLLQPFSRQYKRATGSTPLRVSDTIMLTGHEKFSDTANYISYQAWKKDIFQYVNKENDAWKTRLNRVKICKQQSWCRELVSKYLACGTEELDLILRNVEPEDMNGCIAFLARTT